MLISKQSDAHSQLYKFHFEKGAQKTDISKNAHAALFHIVANDCQAPSHILEVRADEVAAAGKGNMGSNISTLTIQVMDDTIQTQYKMIKPGYKTHTQDRIGCYMTHFTHMAVLQMYII